ncbi:MAG: 4-(cytidine 5'-diphospho)-2-C-methyl-D-erythritol kinase [Candidatus Goldbacteria bacterium]|nr:4-(cytidine 5'-diphospho)-2-C-methyl-D-erythritol kinase [Candidatus Goldiibacteriota bacterium]
MIFLSPAKINLTLHITGRDKKDGYHYLNSIIDAVSLYDLIDVKITNKPEIILKDKLHKLKIPLKKNLIYKAAKLLQEKYKVKKGAVIEFYKYIPDGSGLGGGSSNAATTLKALNKLWDLKVPVKTLEKLAMKIGSDVPFFIKSKYGQITEKGEKIRILKRKKINWYVIVIPKNYKVKTSLAYKWYDIDFVLTETMTYNKIDRNVFLCNDLEPSVLKRKILLRTIKEKLELITQNKKNVSLSGSGSALFSFCETKKDARKIFNKAKKTFKNCNLFLVHSI